jgi:hypothetical protein
LASSRPKHLGFDIWVLTVEHRHLGGVVAVACGRAFWHRILDRGELISGELDVDRA